MTAAGPEFRKHSEDFREKYRSDVTSHLADKLVVARTAEGVPNREPIAVLRFLKPHIATVRGAVAVGVTGSAALGYFSEIPDKPSLLGRPKDPDIDLAMFYDSSVDGHSLNNMISAVHVLDAEYHRNNPKSPSWDIALSHTHDLNLARLDEMFKRGSFSEDILLSMAAFTSKLTVGTDTSRYRQEIGQRLQRLSSEDSSLFVDAAARCINLMEFTNIVRKMPKRTKAVKADLTGDVAKNRELSWRQRIRAAYKLQKIEL